MHFAEQQIELGPFKAARHESIMDTHISRPSGASELDTNKIPSETSTLQSRHRVLFLDISIQDSTTKNSLMKILFDIFDFLGTIHYAHHVYTAQKHLIRQLLKGTVEFAPFQAMGARRDAQIHIVRSQESRFTPQGRYSGQDAIHNDGEYDALVPLLKSIM